MPHGVYHLALPMQFWLRHVDWSIPHGKRPWHFHAPRGPCASAPTDGPAPAFSCATLPKAYACSSLPGPRVAGQARPQFPRALRYSQTGAALTPSHTDYSRLRYFSFCSCSDPSQTQSCNSLLTQPRKNASVYKQQITCVSKGVETPETLCTVEGCGTVRGCENLQCGTSRKNQKQNLLGASRSIPGYTRRRASSGVSTGYLDTIIYHSLIVQGMFTRLEHGSQASITKGTRRKCTCRAGAQTEKEKQTLTPVTTGVKPGGTMLAKAA